MAVNFFRHRDEMLNAWKEVVDDKNKKTDWAVYGYANQSYDLELVAKGSGLDELTEELNSCKILYAFCRVLDPNTELPKNVLINWQGEGAPLARKGVCANHMQDVANFFKGAHITINARTEDDVEPDVILSRVAKASATKLNLKERSEPVENTAPVGSNYQRVQPRKEINTSERESFWTKQQDDEKRRKAADMKVLEESRKKAEEAEKLRELREAKDREQAASRKEIEISKRREAEKNAENNIRNQAEAKSLNANHLDDPDEERHQRSEVLRKARTEEAKSVISGSSIKNARALFEQNTSAGQLKSYKPAPKAPAPIAIKHNGVEKVENKKSVAAAVKAVEQEKPQAPKEEVKEVSRVRTNGHPVAPVVQESVIPKQDIQKVVEVEKKEVAPVAQETVREEVVEEYVPSEDDRAQERAFATQVVYAEPLEDIEEEDDGEDETEQASGTQTAKSSAVEPDAQGLRAKALYDYQAADETEITFDPDDIITHIEQIDEGWWQGMGPDGTYGLFPANYVELIEE